jgi:electron transport complex protein RnfB
MHTVVAELCTGCELCIAPCPVDCITMAPRELLNAASPAPGASLNRERFDARNRRLARRAEEQAAVLAARKQAAGHSKQAAGHSGAPG